MNEFFKLIGVDAPIGYLIMGILGLISLYPDIKKWDQLRKSRKALIVSLGVAFGLGIFFDLIYLIFS